MAEEASPLSHTAASAGVSVLAAIVSMAPDLVRLVSAAL